MTSQAKLVWMGEDVRKQIVQGAISGLVEYGGRWENAAKSSIYPKRGVVTSTYRRSLHAAGPDYSFATDDVKPRPGTPERGGSPTAVASQDKVSIVVGSGMRYARKLENLYNVVQGAHDRVAPDLPDIIARTRNTNL